jgi:hypothetical protein
LLQTTSGSRPHADYHNRFGYRQERVSGHNDDGVFLYAFDLIKLRNPLIVRKTTLGSLLSRAALGLRLE